MSFSRRDFLKLLAASGSTLVVSSGLQGCVFQASDNVAVTFDHGVASGDPLSDRVIIWTRASVANSANVRVGWEVATDSEFKNLVNVASSEVSSQTDHTLKVDVTGLKPGTTYYYRFNANGNYSPVGKTRTLAANPSQVKLAVFSCANYPAGYFHVYGHAATQAEQFDAVVHLGDYIYEYGKTGYPDAGNGEAINRVHSPVTECIRLADYRQRYAQYRTDKDLQTLHAKVPFICVWDDHEIANDTYKAGAENHTPDEGLFTERRAAAIQAWYEWLPVRSPLVENDRINIYRRFDFGNLVSLIMLDTRVVGRDLQLDYANYLNASGDFNSTQFAADIANPSRSMLGAEQLSWLQGQLQSSVGSGTKWQVLGQQVLMGRMELPASIIQPDPVTGAPNPQNLVNYQTVAVAFQALATAVVTALTQDGTINTYAAQIPSFASMSPSDQAIALTTALKTANPTQYGQIFASLPPDNQTALATYGDLLDPAKNPSIPYNLDAWDGYPVEREVVLSTAKALNANLVVLAGDTHNSWANNLSELSGSAVGVEFATSSVSSPGLEKYLSIPVGAEASTEAGILQLVKGLAFFNSSQRGYLVAHFTATEAVAEWYHIPRGAEKLPSVPVTSLVKSLKVIDGQKTLTIV